MATAPRRSASTPNSWASSFLGGNFLAAEMLAARIGGTGQFLRRGFYRSIFGRHLWRGQNIRVVFDYPAALRPGNAELGELWLAGDYTLDGGIVHAPNKMPFAIPPVSPMWLESLHGFDWLRHVLAVQNDAAITHAGDMILHWCVRANRQLRGFPRQVMTPHVVAQRLMAWSIAMPFLRERLDGRALSLLQTTIHTQARWLNLMVGQAQNGQPRLTSAAGLALSGLMLEDGAERLRRGMDMLNRELRRQILADGGHISRAPEQLARVTANMCAIKAGLVARGINVPAQFAATLQRMRLLLAFFRLSDGKLACFHGGLEMSAAEIAPLLEGLKNASVPSFAQRSGYQRIQAGQSCLIIDTGDGVAGADGSNAHAAPLAFEMSHAADRLIVNCGPNRVHGRAWRLAARSIAAHSTLAFETQMIDPFLRYGRAAKKLGAWLLEHDWDSQCRRMEDKNGIWLEMGHGLFVASHAVRHNRRLFIDAKGEDIRGEEALLPAAEGSLPIGAPFHLRFHLHPNVTARLQSGGTAILLLTGSGHGWQFRTQANAPSRLDIEESVYMGRRGIPQRSWQIIIRSELTKGDNIVRWGLRYAGKSGNRTTNRKRV